MEEDGGGENLHFPQHEVLELGGFSIPAWMKIPYISLLILNFSVPPRVSPVSEIWASMVSQTTALEERFPELRTLKLDPTPISLMSVMMMCLNPDSIGTVDWTKLVSSLRVRKENVEAGLEVEGQRMKHLKTLVVRFKHCQTVLSEPRELVEQVVDLRLLA